MRDRFTYRGDSLWWFAELYLHKMQVLNRIFRAALTLEQVFGRRAPGRRMRVVSRDPVRQTHDGGDVPSRRRAVRAAARPGRLYAGSGGHHRTRPLLRMARAARAISARERHAPSCGVTVAAFVHSAFWRGGTEEQYVGPVLRELASRLPDGGMVSIALGPPTSYRARTWRRRVADAARSRGQRPVPCVD